MLASLYGEQRGERLFELINHLNLGRSLIASQRERDDLARLNLEAGEKANAAAAFAPALRYFTAGLELLGEGAWTRQYDLALALTTRAAEAANLAGELEEMERRVEEVLRHGRTLLDRVPAHEVRIQAYGYRGRYLDAVKVGLAILDPLGVRIPLEPSKVRIAASLLRVKLLTAGRSIEDLAYLPAMSDPLKRAAMRVMVAISASVYFVASDVVPVLTFELVRVSLTYGNAPESPYAYAAYAMALSGILGEIPAGYRFGQLARRLVDRPDARKLRAKILCMLACFVNPHSRHLRENLEPFLEAYRAGLQTGDLTYAFYSIEHRAVHQLYAGVVLEEVHRELCICFPTMRRADQLRFFIMRQAVQNLMGRAADPLRLTGEVPDEPTLLRELYKEYNALTLFHGQKLFLAYLFHDYGAALEHAAAYEKFAHLRPSLIHIPVLTGYTALAELAACEAAPKSEQKRVLRKVAGMRKKMKRFAEHAPENHAHRLELIDAEMARVTGDTAKARQAYDRAIELARQNGYVNDEAVANERAAVFYMALGKDRIAEIYWRDARYAYLRWGAVAKVKDLDARFPAFAEKVQGSAIEAADTATVSSSSSTGTLDLLSVMKASQAISSEIVLDGLLRKLMTTLLESAGATRGVLILKGDFPRVVEATHAADGEVVTREVDDDARGAFAETVVRFAERTMENVVLADAVVGPFQCDAYVQEKKPRSILCSPVVRQKKLLAILYMENNLTASAFTPERCKLLEMLSAQTAISLENALLYDMLDNRVKARTRDLSQALERLKETQKQLVMQEKLAAVGVLTSGVAHEIKNPLNFVNNFAELSVRLADELLEELEKQRSRFDPDSLTYVEELLADLRQNASKIQEHGKRADGIVRSMLEHSRMSTGEAREVDLNVLVREYASIAYQKQMAQVPSFDVSLETRIDDSLTDAAVVPGELGRVLLNLLNNAFYATRAKKKAAENGFVPAVMVMTKDLGDRVEIRVRDNGAGIPAAVREKVFNPFFTTKPPGEGTGLGLSISYDIVVQRYGGTFAFESEEGMYTEFCVTLPKRPMSTGVR
jgi:signal transduction histidine kinase